MSKKFELNEADNLALKISKAVIEVCDSYIDMEKTVTTVPEIDGDEEDMKIFLRGLMSAMARPYDIKQEMVSFKNFMETNQKHFRELYKSSTGSHEKNMAYCVAGVTVSGDVPQRDNDKLQYVNTSYLMQYATRLPMTISELGKSKESGPVTIGVTNATNKSSTSTPPQVP